MTLNKSVCHIKHTNTHLYVYIYISLHCYCSLHTDPRLLHISLKNYKLQLLFTIILPYMCQKQMCLQMPHTCYIQNYIKYIKGEHASISVTHKLTVINHVTRSTVHIWQKCWGWQPCQQLCWWQCSLIVKAKYVNGQISLKEIKKALQLAVYAHAYKYRNIDFCMFPYLPTYIHTFIHTHSCMCLHICLVQRVIQVFIFVCLHTYMSLYKQI